MLLTSAGTCMLKQLCPQAGPALQLVDIHIKSNHKNYFKDSLIWELWVWDYYAEFFEPK